MKRVPWFAAWVAGIVLITAGPGGLALAQPIDATADIASARSLSRAFQRVAKRVEPAVVHVTQLSKQRIVQRDFFGRAISVGPEQLRQTGLGSGVLVSEDGFIVTNNHVIRGADIVRVKLVDGREFEARVIGRDEQLDIAVVKIDGTGFPYAEFGDSDQIEVGEWVIAIGSPFGFSSTVTSGIVSAKGRSLAPREGDLYFQDFIQTDAAINPGNSGGPLLDLEGRIIGINSAIATRTGAYEGLGFAIPSSMVRSAMENIRANGRVVRGFLGVQMRAAPEAAGILVDEVTPGGPAERAGIRAGDVIVRYQGRQLDEPRLRNAISLTPPGTGVSVEVMRAGEALTVTVTVGDRARAEAMALGGEIIEPLGAVGASVDAGVLRRLRYRDVEGVVLLQVMPGGAAQNAGLRANDVIVGVGNSRTRSIDQATIVRSPAELDTALSKGNGVRRLFVIRDGEGAYADVAME
jgi:serine protease Do